MMHFLSRIKLDHWVLAGVILGILVFQALPGPRPLDDAYITFRYARSLSLGQGFTYNPGEHVQGTTTLLYTLLLPWISFIIALLPLTPAIARLRPRYALIAALLSWLPLVCANFLGEWGWLTGWIFPAWLWINLAQKRYPGFLSQGFKYFHSRSF